LVVEKKVSGSDAVRIKHAAKQFGLWSRCAWKRKEVPALQEYSNRM
jgi:hypothetical protein